MNLFKKTAFVVCVILNFLFIIYVILFPLLIIIDYLFRIHSETIPQILDLLYFSNYQKLILLALWIGFIVVFINNIIFWSRNVKKPNILVFLIVFNVFYNPFYFIFRKKRI